MNGDIPKTQAEESDPDGETSGNNASIREASETDSGGDGATTERLEASAEADFSVLVHDDTLEGEEEASELPVHSVVSEAIPEDEDHPPPAPNEELPVTPKRRGARRRKRKRGRVARNAQVDETHTEQVQGLPLPTNQYVTTLNRRAIRKRVEGLDASDEKEVSTIEQASEDGDEPLEVYGDISIGMKLSIVAGRVIVQYVNALADGRASPAQLVGVIHRGDVLLSVNDFNLVNLPIDQLMDGLRPLSTPDATGAYQRQLKLRFAAGEGLDLLTKSEAVKKDSVPGFQQRAEAANEMFSLFPMVDQLSGMPLFEDQLTVAPDKGEETKIDDTAKKESFLIPGPSPAKHEAPLDDTIAQNLALARISDRNRFESEFFAWSDHLSGLLRHSQQAQEATDLSSMPVKNLAELMELGRRAIVGAQALSKRMEIVDKGHDVRSFHSWNSTLSLYSRASTRRRYVLDAAVSLPVNFSKLTKDEEEEGSVDDGVKSCSVGSNDEELVDGDELLLRLAAHDDIWRKQVIEFLEKVIQEAKDASTEQQKDTDLPASGDIDDAISSELGSYLFGENMAKIISKHKKPQALPPDEITAVLFDLCTKLSATVPDQITATGSLMSYRSNLVPFTGMKRQAPESDVMLATRFVLDEALPCWLKSFRPLPWEQRRVLWPLEKSSSMESTAASTLSDDLTLDSLSTNQHSMHSKTRRRKSLREVIEDQELDVETRSETCFLVTYYFTQKLLPMLLNKDDSEANGATLDRLMEFVNEYGSYLKMHTCLAYAAVLKAEKVIHLLLEVAKHDPRHREVMRQTSKANAMLFYEPTMLSAVLQRLHSIRSETESDRRLPMIDLCSSAYPDVRPWQVKKALSPHNGVDKSEPSSLEGDMDELYYTYLSLLLHPTDGHDTARHDRSLVQEWCNLSIDGIIHGSAENVGDRRKNFLSVASRSSSDHLAYHRDLMMLLKHSMTLDEYDLALDLMNEFLDDTSLPYNKTNVETVLGFLRKIALGALDTEGDGRKQLAARIMKRVLRLFRKAASSSSPIVSQLVNVPEELLKLLQYRKEHASGSSDTTGLLAFLAEEAEPTEVLEMLSRWTCSDPEWNVVPKLHTILRRGTNASISSELSGALLSLKRARLQIVDDSAVVSDAIESADIDKCMSDESIWKRMSNGMVAVSK